MGTEERLLTKRAEIKKLQKKLISLRPHYSKKELLPFAVSEELISIEDAFKIMESELWV